MPTMTPGSDSVAMRANLWGWAQWLLPPLTLAAVFAISKIFHVFDGVPFEGQDLTPLQAFLFSCGMFLPVSSFFLANGEWNRARAQLSRTWPTVQGVVNSSKIVEKYVSRRGQTYRLEIDYVYKVGTDEYHGDCVEFGDPKIDDEELIKKLAEKYPAGAAVTVHYDPKDPTTAVLETSDESATAYTSNNLIRAYLFLSLPVLFWLVIAIRTAFDWHGWID